MHYYYYIIKYNISLDKKKNKYLKTVTKCCPWVNPISFFSPLQTCKPKLRRLSGIKILKQIFYKNVVTSKHKQTKGIQYHKQTGQKK